MNVIAFLLGLLTGYLIGEIYISGYHAKIRRVLKWMIMIRVYDRYPLSLRFIWFLMRLGIRTDGISSLAHRIYEEVEK